MINKPIPEFDTTAFHEDEFKNISHQQIKGNWAIFLFYPRDFTFICPTELQDMAQFYDEFKELVSKFTRFQPIATMFTKLGTIQVRPLAKQSSQCWGTPPE